MRRLCLFPFGVVALAASAVAVHAEQLPRPVADYQVEGTMTSGKGSNPATIRHGAGKLRLDATVDGHSSAIYIDLAARTATVVTERMGQKIAMHVDPERAGEAANFLERDARRVGESTVAGEECSEYEFETAKGRTLRACVTRDGIPLRTRDLARDRVVWQAARVARGPQSAALFVVPTDALSVHIPKLR